MEKEKKKKNEEEGGDEENDSSNSNDALRHLIHISIHLANLICKECRKKKQIATVIEFLLLIIMNIISTIGMSNTTLMVCSYIITVCRLVSYKTKQHYHQHMDKIHGFRSELNELDLQFIHVVVSSSTSLTHDDDAMHLNIWLREIYTKYVDIKSRFIENEDEFFKWSIQLEQIHTQMLLVEKGLLSALSTK
jgi:hypothetical protein